MNRRPDAVGMDIAAYIGERGARVDAFLASYFERPIGPVPPVIVESMRYSLLAGGKRLRPVLAMAAYEALGGSGEDILACAAAIEVIHTYSLIHDDLPAMDNDDFRRGRPTNHKVYGEAVAILAGDGLLTEAFLMLLSAADRIPERSIIRAIRELSAASGVRGMVGGQVQDLLAEGKEPDGETLLYIHTHKTGALMKASVRLGGILRGADETAMEALSSYGEDLGLAFQIVDDILDVKGDETLLGKPVGSDEQKHKMTYPALYGIEESRQRAGELLGRAVDALGPLGEPAEPLRGIARYILERQS